MKKLKNKILKYWPALILFLATLVLLRFFFKPGFPETHDGQSHLARLANFHIAVIDRHFPVRWARNLNYKFGYPVFHFNYYTPYALALFPKLAGFDFEASFKIVFFLSLFIGGFFWYVLFKKKFGQLPALVAGLFYISAPYQLVNIFVRGSVGEIVALGLFPFLFWSLDRLIDKPSRFSFSIATLGLATLALTHNISFFFGVPILFIYSLILIRQKKDWRRLWPVLLSFGFSVALTLFFWIPALFEKKFTNMDAIDMSHEYVLHFPTLKQLIYSPWGNGFSVPGPDDGFSFQLGPFHWLAAIFSLGLLLTQSLKKKIKRINWLWCFFGLVFAASIIFMNQATLPIWRVLPMVRYIQFPWRLLSFAIIAVVFLVVQLAKKNHRLGLALALGALLYTSLIARPGGWFNWDNHFYYEFPFSSSIKGLNMPKWFEHWKNMYLKPGNIFDLSGTGSIREISWKTQKHVYQVNADQDTEILERTAYFPGWEVRVDGQLVPINYQRKDYPGVISFKLPAGQHTVETKFTENTPARRLGDSISLFSLVAFIFIFVSNWPLKHYEKK